MKCIRKPLVFLTAVFALTSCSAPAKQQVHDVTYHEIVVQDNYMADVNSDGNTVRKIVTAPQTTTSSVTTSVTTTATTAATSATNTATSVLTTAPETAPTTDTYASSETCMTTVAVELCSETSDTSETTSVTQSVSDTSSATSTTSTTTTTIPQVKVNNLNVSTISVSCLKVTWDDQPDIEYDVFVDTDADYAENIHLVYKDKTLLYLTGLRENSYYDITVVPIVKNGESAVPATVTGHTEEVEVIYDFDEDEEASEQYAYGNNTDFFAGESSLGLVADPSRSAIAGAVNDPITDTGICRDEYGDYCCAMGTYFGYCWDRFLITFQNGQQITVKICDSKGDRWYHEFGGYENNHNIIEFIWYGASPPSGVAFTGTWSSFIWNGLDFTHIESIKKINYPDNTVEY